MRRTRWFWLLFGLLSVAGRVVGQSAVIAFVKSGNVFLMGTDGSAQRQVSTGGGVVAARVANRVIVFKRGAQLYRTDAQGSTAVAIPNTSNALEFDLKPTGDRIVLTYSDNANSELYTIGLDGSSKTKIFASDYHALYPSWGRDAYIYFGRCPVGDPYSQKVYRIPEGGGTPTLLVNYFSQTPVEGGPNHRIVFVYNQPAPIPRVMNADGSGQTDISGAPAGIGYMGVAYDYDADVIYYLINAEIWRVNTDGTNKQRLASGVDSAGIDYGTTGAATPPQATVSVVEYAVINSHYGTDALCGYPTLQCKQDTFSTGPQGVGLFFHVTNLPASSTFRLRYIKPDGAVFDSGTMNQNNPFWADKYFWSTLTVNLTDPGAWRILLDINGQTLVTAPFTVTAACTPPAITTQPQDRSITSGQSTTLSTTATGSSPLSYEWYQGNAGDTSHPVGTNSATLQVTPTSTTSYWVRVTNNCGAAASALATITAAQTQCVSFTCSADAPTIGTIGASLTFGGTALSTGCTPFGQYEWQWSFGDGATATTQIATHAFQTPGGYQWSMTVNAGTLQCKRTGNINVSPTTPVPTFTADAVVNAASYQPGLVAGSLATIFGTNLASSTAQATGTPWPTSLGGSRVLVGGIPAPVYYAGPTQINFQVPWEVAGLVDTTVVVDTGAAQSTAVTLLMLTAQPSAFLITPTQVAAVHADGSLLSPANPGRTGEIIALYATGLGPASNQPPNGTPALATPLSKAARTVTVTVNHTTAPVQFAGLAPGLTGVYQLNVQLQSAYDGDPSALQLLVGGMLGAPVPTVSGFQPRSVAPGGEVTITGTGFSDDTRITFTAPDGTSWPGLVTDTQPTTLTAMVLPSPLGNRDQWYQGTVTQCVDNGGQSACAPGALQILPRAQPTLPAGQTLMSVVQSLQQAAAQDLQDLGLASQTADVQAASSAGLQDLQNMINEALAGHPRTITVTDADGQTIPVTFDAATLQSIESILAANVQTNGTLALLSQQNPRHTRSNLASGSCPLADESKRITARANYDKIQLRLNTLAVSAAAVQMGGVILCAAGGVAGCPFVLGSISAVFASASWPIYVAQLGIERADSNMLVRLHTEPTTTTVTSGNTATFKVLGDFANISDQATIAKVVERAATDLAFGLLAKILPKGIDRNLGGMATSLAKMLQSLWGVRVATYFTGAQPGSSETIELTSSTIMPTGPVTGTLAKVTLACQDGSTPTGTITGGPVAPGATATGTFSFSATPGALLWLDDTQPPTTSMSVSVTSPQSAQLASLTLSQSRVQGGNSLTGTVSLDTPNAASATLIQLGVDQASVTVPATVSVPARQLTATFTIATTTVTAQTSATITASYNGVKKQAVLTITPVPAQQITLQSFTIQPTQTTGGTGVTGHVQLTGVAPSMGASISLASNNQTAQPPSAVTIPAGQNFTDFTITTTPVSSSQSVTITATYTGTAKAASLTVLPASPTGAGVLLSDDFSKGADGWQTFAPGWQVVNGVYQGTNAAANTRVETVWSAGTSWTDYTVAAEVAMQDKSEPSDAEVIFRYQDADHYGMCRFLNYSGTSVQLVDMQGGVLGSVPFPAAIGQWYTLRASIRGSAATCEVVGHPETLLTGTYPTTGSGTVALRATHIPVWFDNVLVTTGQQ
jgi:uncharacterized protein (TIGR03437 family)